MTRFNMEAAQAARYENPSLSIFDTGEILEPAYEYVESNSQAGAYRKTGTVDFYDGEGTNIASIFAHPSTIEDDTTLVQIDTPDGGKFKIMLNDGQIFNGDVEVDTPAAALLKRYDEIEAAWVSLVDQDSDAVPSPRQYENHDDALTSLLHDLVSAIRGERTE